MNEKIKVPTPSSGTSFNYTGNNINMQFNDYDSSKMVMSGTSSATEAGEYIVTFTPKDGYEWEDGTIGSKSIKWSIIETYKASPVGYFITDGNGAITGLTDEGKAASEIAIPKEIDGVAITSIGNKAFDQCTNLTSVTIPDSVTSIDNMAFRGCTSLTSITIPDSVTSISNTAFYNCNSLTSITIPNSVTSIGNSAFKCCTSLTSITIPNSVTSISNTVFQGCSNLTSVNLGNSVTSIGNYAFADCTSLTSITIPDSVTSINSFAFYNCTNLSTVYYTGTQKEWNNINIDNTSNYNDPIINATKVYNYQG